MTLREKFDKMEPREQRLVFILLSVLGVFILAAGPIAIASRISGKRADNEAIRSVTEAIYDARGALSERKAKKDALIARYAKPAPQLGSFVEEASKADGISASESQDRPEVPHGKRYSERVTAFKMHKVGLAALGRTFEKIEQSGYPVAFTRLNIKPRLGEPDSYEIEAALSAFDRKPDVPTTGASPASSASAAPTSTP